VSNLVHLAVGDQLGFCNIQVTESTPENRKLVRLSLLRRVYSSVCRAVLKSDKMAAALHIVREMQPQLFKPNASSSLSISTKHSLGKT
jgi:hypothetical protein